MKHPAAIVKAVPVPLGYKHPAPAYEALPTHEFTMGLIAPKGAGKVCFFINFPTTVICLQTILISGNLLSFYKNYFHTILVFSPTIHSDEKWVI